MSRLQVYIIILLLLPLAVLSAQTTRITVIDDITSEACEFSNVVLKTLQGAYVSGGITDENGVIEFDISESMDVSVSYLGYAAQTSRITPGSDLTIRLKTSNFNIDPVVVTGQHQAKPVDESIYKIDLVDARKIQERGVNNLAEALSNETSIRLRVDPSTGTSLKLQGLGGENVKYLIDGVPLVGRVAGNIDLSQIQMENIDHIEIVQGPMSVQYGTSAIAGVINIITKKNNYFRNLVKANSYIDSRGTYTAGIYGSLNRKNHTFTVSGNRNIFQGVDIDLNVDPDDEDGHDRYMEFKPKLTYNADAEYAYRKKDLNIRVKSQYMNSLLKNYSNYLEKVILAYDADYHTTRLTNSLILSNNINKDLSYNLTAAYTYYGRTTDHITSDLHLLTKEITSSLSTRFNNYMCRGNLSFAPENKIYSVTGGWDLNFDNGKGEKLEDSARIGDYALFLSSQISPAKNISFQPGIRMIYNTIYGAPVIPSFNIQWKIADQVNLRLSYARGFRAPSLKELYLDFRDSNHDLSGNKDLKAETTNSYNGSLEYILKTEKFHIKVSPGLFYNNGKDAITLIVTNQNSNSATNINLGGRRTLGGEINTSFYTRKGLSLGLGFSRIGETFDEEGEGEYEEIVYYNNYSFNTRYTIPYLDVIFLGSLKYYGETPSLTSVPEEEGGGYYRVYKDPYGDAEITLSKNLWKNRINLVLGAKNLLNNYEGITSGFRDYGDADFQESYLNPLNYGRTWFFKLNVKISK